MASQSPQASQTSRHFLQNPLKPLVAMKNLIPLTAIAALVASGISSAQTPAYSAPIGYVTQDLVPNTFNLVGLSLHGSPLVTGDFEAGSGNDLVDDELSFAPTPGRTYVLEILDGSIAGTVQALAAASFSGTTITTPDDLVSMGLATGAKYAVRLAPTLEEIFGVDSDSVLARSLNSNTADIVWLMDGMGGFNKYFVHVSGEFRISGTATAAPNVSVIYSDGLLVQKRGVASSLVLTGQVKTDGTNSVASQGFNLVSVVAPAGLTLFTSGLDDDLAPSLNFNTADIVWLPTGTGTYTKYYRHVTGNWRDVSDSGTNMTVDVPLPSAIWIQRRSATPANISIDVPSSFDNL